MLGPVTKSQRQVNGVGQCGFKNIPWLVLGSSSSVFGMTEAHKKPFWNRNHLSDTRINDCQIKWNKKKTEPNLRHRVHGVELQRCCPQLVQVHGNGGNFPVLLWIGSDVVEQQGWKNCGGGKKWWRYRWVRRVVEMSVHLNVLQWALHSVAPFHDSILPNSCRSREILWKVSKPLYRYEARSQPESAHTPEQQSGHCENL